MHTYIAGFLTLVHAKGGYRVATWAPTITHPGMQFNMKTFSRAYLSAYHSQARTKLRIVQLK